MRQRKRNCLALFLSVLACMLVIGIAAGTRNTFAAEEPAIESIEITALSADEFYVESALNLAGTEFTVIYDDGTTEALEIENDYGVYDSYGNYLEYYVRALYEDGDSGEYYYEYLYHKFYFSYSGIYTIGFDYYDTDGDFICEINTDTEVEALPLTVSNLTNVTEIAVGETCAASIENNADSVWFSFTVDTAGSYIFRSLNNVAEDGNLLDLYVILFEADEDGILMQIDSDDDSGSDWNFILKSELEEGVTYYCQIMGYNDCAGTFDVQLLEAKDVESFSVGDLSKTEFTQALDLFDLSGTVITIRYTDGMSAEAVVDGDCAADAYGNDIYYYIEDGDGYYSYGDALILGVGTYSVTFVLYDDDNEIWDTSKTVEVTSMEGSDQICVIEELYEAYEATLEAEEIAWYSYTPEADGWYYFNVQSESEAAYDYCLYYIPFYFDEDGNFTEADEGYDENTGYEAFYLYEGITYYTGIYYYASFTEDFDIVYLTVTVSMEIGEVTPINVDEISATELTLDVEETAEITEEGASAWFYFTPEEDGAYFFCSLNNEYEATDEYEYAYEDENGDIITETVSYTYTAYTDTYAYLYVLEDDGTLTMVASDDDGANDLNFGITYNLTAGTTYYCRVMLYDVSGTFDVKVTKSKVIDSISVVSLGQTEFVQILESLDLSGTVIEITYTDGTVAEVTIEDGYALDEYFNYISYYIYDEENDEWYGDSTWLTMAPGVYTVTFYTYDADGYEITAEADITVTALADADNVTVIEKLDQIYATETTSDEYAYYIYTPAEDGQYYFTVDFSVEEDRDLYFYYDLFYLDEDGNIWWPDYLYDEDGDIAYAGSGLPIYELEGGVTYYYYVYTEVYITDEDGWIEEWDPDAAVTIDVSVSQIGHEHTYEDADVVWEWADDYSSATATLYCDTCSYIAAEAVEAVVTSETTEATATEDGKIVYTATVTINGVVYTDTRTVILPATGEAATAEETTEEATTEASAEETTAAGETETAAADENVDSTGTNSTGGTSAKTGDVSVAGYFVILLAAAAAVILLAKKNERA